METGRKKKKKKKKFAYLYGRDEICVGMHDKVLGRSQSEARKNLLMGHHCGTHSRYCLCKAAGRHTIPLSSTVTGDRPGNSCASGLLLAPLCSDYLCLLASGGHYGIN